MAKEYLSSVLALELCKLSVPRETCLMYHHVILGPHF